VAETKEAVDMRTLQGHSCRFANKQITRKWKEERNNFRKKKKKKRKPRLIIQEEVAWN
jgi:hypothetical protein